MTAEPNTSIAPTPGFPDCLVSALRSIGVLDIASIETARGGNTSQVWTISRNIGPSLVAKASYTERGTPLFPNRPTQEWAAMLNLSAHGLSPFPVSRFNISNGGLLLVSQAIEQEKELQASDLANLLARVHSRPAWPGLLDLTTDMSSVLREGATMLVHEGIPGWLERMKPNRLSNEQTPLKLVHRDLVPANVVVPAGGQAIALDWQCPARGDPCEDIAHATSPAMQSLSEIHPRLDPENVVEAYPDPVLRRRFYRVEPAYRWRMACYCQWKIRQGEEQYRRALDLECAALEDARDRANRHR